MPIAYFKCTCGAEYRDVVPFDHSQEVYNERTKRWDFDPSLPKTTVEHTHTCASCGLTVPQSDDPKAVKSFLQFNWMADE